MSKYFIVRDRRLNGSLPKKLQPITAFVDATTSMQNALVTIAGNVAVTGKIKSLFILCHGYESGFSFLTQGGLGLQLGKEDLKPSTVDQWKVINGMVERIVVYSCGAAYTGTDYFNGSTHDGQSLMSKLAKNTGAFVFAADKTQWYNPNFYDFGEWEGNVYMFFPTGGMFPFQPSDDLQDVVKDLNFFDRFNMD